MALGGSPGAGVVILTTAVEGDILYQRNGEKPVKVKMVPIGDVKPYPNNPRINAGAVEGVAASLKQFGWQQPIVVDSSMVIVVGHTRLLAAQMLEQKKVPVTIADKLSDSKIAAYRLADNRTGEFAFWDVGLLELELDALKGADDIDLKPFNMDEYLAGPEPDVKKKGELDEAELWPVYRVKLPPEFFNQFMDALGELEGQPWEKLKALVDKK